MLIYNEKAPTGEMGAFKSVCGDSSRLTRNTHFVHPKIGVYPIHRAVRTPRGWLVLAEHWCGRKTYQQVATREEALDVIAGGCF